MINICLWRTLSISNTSNHGISWLICDGDGDDDDVVDDDDDDNDDDDDDSILPEGTYYNKEWW